MAQRTNEKRCKDFYIVSGGPTVGIPSRRDACARASEDDEREVDALGSFRQHQVVPTASESYDIVPLMATQSAAPGAILGYYLRRQAVGV